MRYGRHIITLDPKVDPKNDAVAISYPHIDSRLGIQLQNSTKEVSSFYQTTWLWESFTFISTEKGLKSLQLVADFPRENIFKNAHRVKKYVKLWKYLEKIQKRKTLLENALVSNSTKGQSSDSYRRKVGFSLWSKHSNLLRKVYSLKTIKTKTSSSFLSSVLNNWDSENARLSRNEKSRLLDVTTTLLLLSSNSSDNQYAKLWWKVRRGSSENEILDSINSFPTLLDQSNTVFLEKSKQLRDLIVEITNESGNTQSTKNKLLFLDTPDSTNVEVNLVSPLGSKMSVEAYNKMNEELLSELTLKYTKLLKMFEIDNVKAHALRSLKDKLLDLKKLNESNTTPLSKFNLSEYTPLLQNLIDTSSLTQSITSDSLPKASVFTEEVWGAYWDLMCEDFDDIKSTSGDHPEVRLLHWLLLQSFVKEWDQSDHNTTNSTHVTLTPLFNQLKTELHGSILLRYSERVCSPRLITSSENIETIENLNNRIIADLALKVSTESTEALHSSEKTRTFSFSRNNKTSSNENSSNENSSRKSREDMTADEKLRADAQEKAFKVDEVKHNRYDLNFLRKEFMFTKLKYSRCPAYDSVSGGFAALFAGFIGFLISEKFGIELVDSGDFYVGLMYVLFASFILRLFIFSTTDSIDETPSFIFSFYPIKLFYKELLLTLAKRLKGFLFK